MSVRSEGAAQLFPFGLIAIDAPGIDQFADRRFVGKFHPAPLLVPRNCSTYESSTGSVACTDGRDVKAACQAERRRWRLRQSCSAKRNRDKRARSRWRYDRW